MPPRSCRGRGTPKVPARGRGGPVFRQLTLSFLRRSPAAPPPCRRLGYNSGHGASSLATGGSAAILQASPSAPAPSPMFADGRGAGHARAARNVARGGPPAIARAEGGRAQGRGAGPASVGGATATSRTGRSSVRISSAARSCLPSPPPGVRERGMEAASPAPAAAAGTAATSYAARGASAGPYHDGAVRRQVPAAHHRRASRDGSRPDGNGGRALPLAAEGPVGAKPRRLVAKRGGGRVPEDALVVCAGAPRLYEAQAAAAAPDHDLLRLSQTQRRDDTPVPTEPRGAGACPEDGLGGLDEAVWQAPDERLSSPPDGEASPPASRRGHSRTALERASKLARGVSARLRAPRLRRLGGFHAARVGDSDPWAAEAVAEDGTDGVDEGVVRPSKRVRRVVREPTSSEDDEH